MRPAASIRASPAASRRLSLSLRLRRPPMRAETGPLRSVGARARSIAGRALFLACLVCPWPASAQSARYTLFNGRDLGEWETQGVAGWTVANGEIRGYKSAAQGA